MKSLALVAALATASLSMPAAATWSIAAINPDTATMAVAGASCSFMVYGIDTIVPGKGVVIVQAASNRDARQDAAAMMAAGEPFDAIMARITAAGSDYHPERQQYALLSLDGSQAPRQFTGDQVTGVKAAMASPRAVVQANTMASAEVVPRTFAALGGAKWSDDVAMAKTLMQAMNAGADAGGDKRCGQAGSASAFIKVQRKGDEDRQQWLTLVVYGLEPGSQSALARLNTLFDQWLHSGIHDRSTSVFMIPGAKAAAVPAN